MVPKSSTLTSGKKMAALLSSRLHFSSGGNVSSTHTVKPAALLQIKFNSKKKKKLKRIKLRCGKRNENRQRSESINFPPNTHLLLDGVFFSQPCSVLKPKI